VQPTPLFVYLAEVLHGFSSCTLGPAIAAMSLAIAGHAALGPRLGRNARYAAIGNALGAALMGTCGYYVSEQAVFFLTAVLTLPAFFVLLPLRTLDPVIPPTPRSDGKRGRRRSPREVPIGRLLSDRRLLIFATCAGLFTFANAAMLPIASGAITKQAGSEASLLIAASIVIPQVIVTLLSPSIGWLAEARGRRWVLLLGFCILPVRGLLFALTPHPILVLPIQALDALPLRASASCSARRQRHRRALGPFQPVPGLRRPGDRGRCDLQHGRRRLDRRCFRRPVRLRGHGAGRPRGDAARRHRHAGDQTDRRPPKTASGVSSGAGRRPTNRED